ncbi:MAG: AAA family ATPase, partial [Deltaproteobacteria bacterium]|nr:AAA family ATPase [Deltaproteobacteria bacterium]
MNISEILELNERAKEDGKNFSRARQLFSQIQSEPGRHFIGIVGPRGVGKTVLLKQLALSEPDSFYLSADTLALKQLALSEPDSFYLSADTLAESDLFQIARILSEQYKINIFLVDEIHFCKTYAKDLKKIYDFLNIRVVFTSSVSLSLF